MLELPGQRRVKFFNTSPPLSVVFLVLALFPTFVLVLIVTVVLESSDQRRVRILYTLNPHCIIQTSVAEKLHCKDVSALPGASLEVLVHEEPSVGFLDLLYALEQHKSISTEYGLNVSVHQHWRFGDLIRRQLILTDMTMRLQWQMGLKPTRTRLA